MKLIIDVPEDVYRDAKILILKDFPVIKKAIINSIPYEERPQGEWLASDIRWTDKLSVKCNGDIIDFEGRVVGHINLENWIKEAEND